MTAHIGSAHGDRRYAGGQREQTTMWFSAGGCLVTLALGILVAPLVADAQRPGEGLWRIGLFHVDLDHVPLGLIPFPVNVMD